MSGSAAEERRRFDEYYGGKWLGHEGFWLDRYPPSQHVYATAVYQRRNEAILDAVGSGGVALDLGCGVGDVASLLAHRGFRVEAIDVSLENARRARDNLLSASVDANVALAQAEDLPFADGTFDVAVVADVIEHVGSVDRSFREVCRVLRPGGRVICVTPIRATLQAWRVADGVASALTTRTSGIGRRGVAWRHPDVRERFLSKRELRRALTTAGLQPLAFRRVCFYPAPETAGTFGALMGRIYRRSPEGFEQAATRALRVFDLVSTLRIFNQKQLWVAVRCA